MSGSENTWKNKDLESITKEITDTNQLSKNTIKRHISKFWDPKELSPSKRHCYVPLDCSVRHIFSFSTSPRGSHACSNWAFSCSASLLPLTPIRTPGSLIWDFKCFVVKRHARNKDQGACKWNDWASWKCKGGQAHHVQNSRVSISAQEGRVVSTYHQATCSLWHVWHVSARKR